MGDDDRELLDRIQKGDAEGFGKLYDRTRGWLLSIVIVPRVGRAESEDVLAETFRVALASIKDFEWRGVGLLHWLASIAKKKSLERARSAARAPESIDDLPSLVELSDDAPTAEAEMIRTEMHTHLRERVHRTLAKIPPRYAEALRLRLLEGNTRQGCAESLGISLATFDVVLYRATRAFRREWSQHA